MIRRLVLLASLVACGSTADPTAVDPDPKITAPTSATARRAADQAYWVTRTDAELDAAFDAVCAQSLADGKPVLLAFSAPWCPDCRRVRDLSAASPLADELAQWHVLVIDPGRFDANVPVLEAFGVSSIVRWVAARPDDCRMPAPGWRRLREGTFEPATGEPWTGAQLAMWLSEARSS